MTIVVMKATMTIVKTSKSLDEASRRSGNDMRIVISSRLDACESVFVVSVVQGRSWSGGCVQASTSHCRRQSSSREVCFVYIRLV